MLVGGSLSEVVLVCMPVCYGFMVEIYGFRHTLRTCLARDAHDAAMEVVSRLRTRRIKDDSRTSPEI